VSYQFVLPHNELFLRYYADLRRKKGASWKRHLNRRKIHVLVGHEDGVDYVNDAVGLEDVCGGDGGGAALGVGEHDLST
jgi:hypothetical protein